MADDFVHALSPLRILLIRGHEARADSLVARLPILAAVVRSIDPSRRDRHEHSFRTRRIGKNRVQAQAAAAGLPLRAMRMIEEAAIERPRLAAVG